MSIATLVIALIAIGAIAALGLRGRGAKRIALAYLAGLVATLGGCYGAARWIADETSGRESIYQDVNPFAWVALFAAGVLVLVVNSILALRKRHGRSGDPGS